MSGKLAWAVAVVCLAAGLCIGIAAAAPAESGAMTDDVSQRDLQDIIGNLQASLAERRNTNMTDVERQKQYDSITANILDLLRVRGSTLLADAELESTLPGIRFQTKVANISGMATKVRIVRWDCFPGWPCGTLPRFWTYVQWWDDSSLNVQVLSAKGGSTPADFLVLAMGEKPTLVLAEYSREYSPFPWLLATWQLKGDEWVKAEMFGPNVAGDDSWEVRIYGNSVRIEIQPKRQLWAEPNAAGDGFVFFVKEDKSKVFELRIKDGLVVRKR